MITRSERIVLCAAVIVRAALPILAFMHARDGRIFTSPDTGSYIACAASLARGEGFTTGGEPEIARTQGYPLLLVPGVLARHLAAVTIPLQIALGVLTVWLVFSLTGSLTGRPRAAFIAGLFCAYEPLSIFYCSLLLTETLFATVLLVSLFFLVRFLNAGHAPALALSACGFAAAVYVRPIAYWLPLAMVTVILASIWEGRDNRTRKIFGGCAFLALCVVLIGAWQVRNYHVAGYRGFSAISDSSLYFYQGAAVHSALTGEAYDTVQRERGFSLNQEQKNSTPAQRYSYMGNEGRTIIRAHPLVFMREYVKGLVRTAFGPGATEYLRIFGLYKEGHGLL